MFSHRVLPPLKNFSFSSLPDGLPSTAGRDTLLENRIMTTRTQSYHQQPDNIKSALRPELIPRTFSHEVFLPKKSSSIENYQPYHTDAGSEPKPSISAGHKRSISERSSEGDSKTEPSPPPATGVPSRNSRSPSSQICLCQPDPKVPRPRNAFILFRQHHQGTVVSQHPGLTNPEISKIIGDSWRAASDDVKNHWKELAEEEKIRHSKQYPDYRYQPRKPGRPSVGVGAITDPETQRCLKCGGKIMAAPQHLPPPGVPATTASSPRLQAPVNTLKGPTGFNGHFRYAGTPGPSPQPLPIQTRYHGSNSSVGSLARQVSRGVRLDEVPPGSPELKRRRYEVSPYSPDVARTSGVPPVLSPYSRGARHLSVSLPNRPVPPFEGAPRSSIGSVQSPLNHSFPRTLAPLYVSPRDQASQHKAVEAMIMSIPPVNRIRVLSKVSPPLGVPSLRSPDYETRGAIIAVEGTDYIALQTVVDHLVEVLERDNGNKVRIFAAPEIFPFKPDFTAQDWLRLICEYYEESKEMVKYITKPPQAIEESPISPKTVAFPPSGASATTASKAASRISPPPPTPSPGSDAGRSRSINNDAESMDVDEGKSPGPPDSKKAKASGNGSAGVGSGGSSRRRPLPIGTASPSTATTATTMSPSARPSPTGPMPIAIVCKYQLTLTDAAAAAVPIADGYSPIDHWQWMAALWRGITGPDVTVYVRTPTPELAATALASPRDMVTPAAAPPPHHHPHPHHRPSPSAGSNGTASAPTNGETASTSSSHDAAGPTVDPASGAIISGSTHIPYYQQQQQQHQQDLSQPPISSGPTTSGSAPTATSNGSSSITNSSNGGSSGGGGGGSSGGAVAIAQIPAVDVKLHEARAVLLRGDGQGRVSESGLRRVGFEVGEWLRTGLRQANPGWSP